MDATVPVVTVHFVSKLVVLPTCSRKIYFPATSPSLNSTCSSLNNLPAKLNMLFPQYSFGSTLCALHLNPNPSSQTLFYGCLNMHRLDEKLVVVEIQRSLSLSNCALFPNVLKWSMQCTIYLRQACTPHTCFPSAFKHQLSTSTKVLVQINSCRFSRLLAKYMWSMRSSYALLGGFQLWVHSGRM